MKRRLIFVILVTFQLGIYLHAQKPNEFSSYQDTLIIKTEKVKGYGMFPAGAGQISFQDTMKRYDFPVIFPGGISDIKLTYKFIDSKPFKYEYLKKNQSNDLAAFLAENYPRKIDTAKIPSISDNSISIMSGRKGENSIYIVDENNNKDFRDDPVRLYNTMDWHTSTNLIKCKYKIYNGKSLVEDSTWVNIGSVRDNDLLFFVSNHLESTFSLDKQIYQIGVVDEQSNFCFDEPILALISQNGIKKDTLLEMELLKKGEYLKLNKTYYRIDNISNDGSYITFVKENNFSNKIGTQVGMIAPDFYGHTTNGDSISYKNYAGRYLLLINVTACWSEISSYSCYKDLTEYYKGKLDFLGLDNSFVTLKNNIKSLNLSGQFIIVDDNTSLKSYRPGFCSRTCFLINPEGRIVDKFEIFDWKSNLAKFFEDKKKGS